MLINAYLPLLFVLTVTANPLVQPPYSPISLQVAKRVNASAPRGQLVKHDRERARALASSAGGAQSVTSMDQVVNYAVTVNIGDPPTEYTLLVDTGSSNTWVGANPTHRYQRSSTSVRTGQTMSVAYGSAVVLGNEWLDQVSLSSNLTIQNQSIGAAFAAPGVTGVDGILGVGPKDLTCGSLSPDTSACISTITESAFDQQLIGSQVLGISFAPTTSTNDDASGELTFGGTNSDKYTGEITYVPISGSSPANRYVGIDQSVTYGSSNQTILAMTSGIVDTGTTLLLLSDDAFETYVNVTGAVHDDTTGLLRITPAQYANLQSLFFNIGEERYEFTANAQIWPRQLNSALGGQDDAIYLIVSSTGPAEDGLGFINGMMFIERFYTVYDAGNARVGFAYTSNTYAETN